MPKADEETVALRKELTDLAAKCRELQSGVRDSATIEGLSSLGVAVTKIPCRKIMKGHINKVTCCHFSGDSRHLVTGSLDGKLIVWDCWTANKTQVIPLRSAWVMTSVFAPSGNVVGCGGMDNMLTVYDMNNRDSSGVAKMLREFAGYEGFLSSCRFIDDNTVLTGSGDMKIMEWNIETGAKLIDIAGHLGDVASLDLKPEDSNVFLTGSVDRTIRLWDLREQKCNQIFWGHDADVNCVQFHPCGQLFATCSEDKTTRLWDIRSDQEVTKFEAGAGAQPAYTSCGVSVSGRLVMSAADDSNVYIWDIGDPSKPVSKLANGHTNRITEISVAPSGICVASSSWDTSVRAWAL